MAAFQVPSNPLEVSPWVNHQGSLPPEVDIEGNIEYKLKLIATAPDRFEHLVTQLKWRLSEGHGNAIYEIGVADDGSFVGLSPEDMDVSLKTLHRMAEFLKADVTILRKVSVESTQHFQRDQEDGEGATQDGSLTPLSRRVFTNSGSPRTEPEYLVVEAQVTSRLAEEHHFLEIRVALVGGPDAGKSTLLGRLAHGIADNGRGKARLNLLRHRHEISSGRTSSISHEIMGFTAKGETVNYNTTNISSWQEVCESSAKVVTLLDTCGHPRFLKTTISGLTGHSPDYACLVVDSRVGGVSEMTKEHLALSTALGLPTFVVVTKMDVATRDQLRATVTALMTLIRATGSSCLPSVHNSSPSTTATTITSSYNTDPSVLKLQPVIVHNEKDLESVVKQFSDVETVEEKGAVAIPILLLSSVTGENVGLLERFLYLLPKPPLMGQTEGDSQDPACYQIEEIYNIPDIGTVVGGFLHSGKIEVHKNIYRPDEGVESSSGTTREGEKHKKNMRLYLGPVDRDGGFIPVLVKSIHRQRMSMRSIDSGHTATLAIEGPDLSHVKVRRGMVVLESDTDPRGTCCQKFEAVIQVLAHDGVFGSGFQGMIHCGSVHQNAKVIKIELLPGPEQDDGATVEDDGLGALEVRPRSWINTGRESVLSHRSSSPSSDYESGTGSSMHGSVPVSRSGSFRGSVGEAGDDHGSISDDALPREKQRHRGSSAQGMIPITTMRTFRRMSIKNSSHTDLSSSSLPWGSSTGESMAVQDTKDEDEDEDTNPSAEMSTGSRARVVFRFCHDVAFMREGTTVLFRHGRTKCVGKVLRML
ncbi:GTP binding protein [Podila minutissima]|uniref:GTP binding protein n=1 Tax=Podila minutissima TaxID=64525 RepID=A0A9P5VI53_9FUNG|nr:GTP binding protein [Podila minutissima]